MVASYGLFISSPNAGNKNKSITEQDNERKKRINEIDEFFDQAVAYQSLKNSEDNNFLQVPSWEAMIPVIEGKPY